MTDMTLDDIVAENGPIEPHLAALASDVDLPDLAVAQCTLRVEEVAPTLRAVVGKAADGAALSGDEARLLLRGVFILGCGRDAGAFPIFLRLLRRPEAELSRLLGDVLETRLAKLLSGMFDGDVDALLGLASDATCVDEVRFSAMEAAAFLTFDVRIARERMHTFLADAAEAPASKGDMIWIVWADTIARLGFRDLAPLVEAALADGRIAKGMLRKRQFDKDLAAAEASPEDPGRFKDASYIADVLEALDWSRTGGMSDYSLPTAIAADAPIEVHLAALGTELHLPEVALTTCVARVEEAAPLLRALLDRAAAGRPLSEDESLRLFRGLYVLAAVRDTASCPSLLRMLRRPTHETEELLGDGITGGLPRLAISVFDGNAEALLAVVADPTLDDYLRGSVLEAATYLAWEGRIDREELRRFLVQFYETRPAEDEAYVWYSWMEAVALLDFGDLVPMVEAAWKARRIDHAILEWSDFRNDLARARTAWDDVGRFSHSQVGYVDDVVAELDWTRHWADEDAASTPWPLPATTVTNPFKNVGRNDPCPCGSGRKAKKCCLATA